LLVFLSTFPVVIPFILFDEVKLALRLSHAVAMAMLFACGYAFGRCIGVRPWAIGIAMIAVGGTFAGLAIVLGG
jgi:VIT1/CCC1 family predicted Fe2+/Mn2+ transporter